MQYRALLLPALLYTTLQKTVLQLHRILVQCTLFYWIHPVEMERRGIIIVWQQNCKEYHSEINIISTIVCAKDSRHVLSYKLKILTSSSNIHYILSFVFKLGYYKQRRYQELRITFSLNIKYRKNKNQGFSYSKNITLKKYAIGGISHSRNIEVN